LIIVLLSFISVTVASYHLLLGEIRDIGIEQTTDMMLHGYKNELKEIVDVMAISLSSAVQGVTDEAQIYQNFSMLVKGILFFPDESGYYFIYKKGGTVFVHAAQPYLEGKNLLDFRDLDGKLVIKELDEVAQSGGGYVEYLWEKPYIGLTPKLSYARMIPGTEYWIGTGVYIDDIQNKKADVLGTINKITNSFLKKFYLALGLALILLVGPLFWLIIRSIVKPIIELTNVANEYSLGNLNLSIPATTRKDEIGKLASAIERLGVSIQIAKERRKRKGCQVSTFDNWK